MSEFSFPVWHLEILGGGQSEDSKFFLYLEILGGGQLNKPPCSRNLLKWEPTCESLLLKGNSVPSGTAHTTRVPFHGQRSLLMTGELTKTFENPALEMLKQ